MELPAYVKRFRFFGILTVASVYLLILVGGVVRSTGSGMGCPDWPKCFGSWVPPTSVNELPANYKEVYTAQRVAKNKRLAATLEKLGFQQVAGNIFAHPTQYIETDFNAVKTWIEYINRLVGALIGVFVFLTVVLALPYWFRDRAVFWLSFAAFILTGVQGWLGSLVVSTNLLPVMVTVHMGLALVIVAILIYAVERSQRIIQLPRVTETAESTTALTWWLVVAMVLTFGQIVLGTQVREQVDMVASAANYAHRDMWVAQLGSVFNWHRTFSAVLLLVNVYVTYGLFQTTSVQLKQLAVSILVLIATEIAAGITLAYLSLPAIVQPIHLTVGTLLFGAQFLTFIHCRQATKSVRRVEFPQAVA